MDFNKPFHNSDFIAKLHPIKIVLLSLLAWAILFFTSPLVVQIPLNEDAYIFFSLSMLSFILGVWIHRTKNNYTFKPKNSIGIKKLFNLVLIIAFAGLFFKIIDRFFIRGINLSSDYFQNREMMEAGGGNPLAILSTFLTPFGLIPIFLVWKYKLKISRILFFTCILLFFTQIFDALLLGSRSIIFVLFIYFGLYLIYFKKIKLSFSRVILLVSVVISFMVLMNYIFIERTKQFAGKKTYELVLNQSAINYTVTSSHDFKQNFNEYTEFQKSVIFNYITTTQYFTHGMIEFSYLYDNHKGEFTYGEYTFVLYARFLYILVGEKLDVEEVLAYLPRQGVFTTFLGPTYIDFGWFSLVFMFFFGRITKSVYDKAKNGNDWAILIYFYLFIVIIFFPVFNFVNGAGGIFMLSSFILFYFVSKSFYKYEKID